MPTGEDTVRRIRALLATAESLAASGHEEAAHAYVAKAHALQQRHSIDAALLNGPVPRRGAVVTRTWAMPGGYGRRKVDLAHVAARNTGCTGYFRTGSAGGAYQYVVFGYPADVEWAETLTFSLCHQAEAALGAAPRSGAEHGRSFATSFLAGFTDIIDDRLAAVVEEVQAQAQARTAPGTTVAVVLAAKADRVEAEMRATVSNLRSTRSDGGTSASGWATGRAAGRRAALARGSAASAAARRLGR